MKINLTGKKAWIGGSSSGIGRAIATVLASCGAEVYLVGRDEQKLQYAISQLDTSHDQQHQYLLTDFNNYQQYKADVSSFFEHYAVDILINNTNGPAAGNIRVKNEHDYQQAFELLFQNAVLTTTLALPYMKQQGFGRIINVSSMTVKEPQDNLILSNTMRTALVSWSKSLSNEVAKEGITVNTVLTGYFDTDRLNSLMESQAQLQGSTLADVRVKRIGTIPVKRLGGPEEYGFLVAFLASEYASFLTGASIPLDGGMASSIF